MCKNTCNNQDDTEIILNTSCTKFKVHPTSIKHQNTNYNPRNEQSTLHCITAQKMKFSIKDFFSKCDQIRRKLRIWSHLLKKS